MTLNTLHVRDSLSLLAELSLLASLGPQRSKFSGQGPSSHHFSSKV
jgi:hypothetical protein